MAWWMRPLVRLGAALMLPLIVPAVITAVMWALPGNPVSILCPEGLCPEAARTALAEKWHLDQGPYGFYSSWLSNAFQGDFGSSWRVQQGIKIDELLWESVPVTSLLICLAMVPLIVSSVLVAMERMPEKLDYIWQGIGLVPAVIFALICTAYVQVTYGALSFEGWPSTLRLLLGALVLGTADGALSGAITGTRSVFTEEFKARYVQMAILRGESRLSNALPNILGALVGQFRGRVLHILSGAVIVEVVLQIQGLGELLWKGTLLQDFGVVLAATFGFSLISSALLIIQACTEISIEVHVRRSPKVAA